jgi:hypothetical protein
MDVLKPLLQKSSSIPILKAKELNYGSCITMCTDADTLKIGVAYLMPQLDLLDLVYYKYLTYIYNYIILFIEGRDELERD